MKSYVFKAQLDHEDDGRWSAVIPSLPGCATWGHSSEEALEALQEMAQAYVEVLLQRGDAIPEDKAETIVLGRAVVVTTEPVPI